MAVSEDQLSVEVVLDSKGAIKGIKDLNGAFVELSTVMERSTASLGKSEAALDGIGKKASDTGKKTMGMGSQISEALSSAFVPITALNQGFQLLSATIGKLVSSVSSFVNDFAEAEKAQVNLEKTMAMLSNRVKGTADQWGVYLDALQETTGANGDMLRSQVAMALKIGISEKQTKDLVEASVKLAAVSGEDVNGAFESLLGTYKGVGRAVGLYVNDVNNLTHEQLKNGAAIDLVNSKYKGVEGTFNSTLSGAIKGTKLQFGELSESIGQAIAKTLSLDTTLRSATSGLKTVQAVVDSIDFAALGKGLAEFGAIAATLAVVALPAVRTQLVGILTTLRATAGPALIAAAEFLAIAAGLAVLAIAVDLVIRNFGQLGNLVKTIAAAIGVGFLTAVEVAADALVGLFGKIPGLEQVAIGLKGISQVAKKTGDSLAEMGAKASDTIDTGIAGTIWEQGKKALAAFNGEAGKTGETLSKVSSIKGPPSSLMDAETLKKLEEAAKKAGEAYLAFADSVRKLADASALNVTELLANAQDPRKGMEAAEKQYQTQLLQIQAERDKAVQNGVSLRAADELASKGVLLAETIRDQTAGLEVQKQVKESMLAFEKAAEEGLAALHAQSIASNETILRIGMTKNEIAARELQVELDKIDALEEQIQAAGKLDRFARAELELARQTAVEKNKADNAPKPGTPEAAPVIGGAAAAVGAIGAGPVGAFMGAAEMIVGAVQKLIDFIPNILNAVAKIFSSLADLPLMILKAIQNLLGSIVKFISEFIPNLFKAIPEIISSLLTAIFDTIPKAIQKLLESLPTIIAQLVDAMPDLVVALVEGLVSSSVTIAVGLIEAIIQGVPKIIISLVQNAPKITFAIIKGIINGLKTAFSAIGGLFKGAGAGLKSAAKSIGTAITGGLKKLTGFKGNLFGVAEDVVGKNAAIDGAKALVDQINNAGKNAWAWLGKAWEALKQAFIWVYEMTLKPFIDLLKIGFALAWSNAKAVFQVITQSFMVVWQFAKDTFMALVGLLQGVWNVVKVGIIDPFINALRATWEYVKTGIIDPAVMALRAVWDFVKSMFDAVIQTFQALWNFVKTLFDDPIKAFQNLWSDLKSIFAGVINAFSTLGSKLWDSLKAAFDGAVSYFKNIGTIIWDGLKNAWDAGVATITNFGSKLFESTKTAFTKFGDIFADFGSNLWNGFKKAFSGIGDFFKDIFSKLDPGNLLKKLFPSIDYKGKGAVENFIGLDFPWLNFAEGGNVPGRASVFGNSLKNDTVPALLSPGEAVIPRSLMNDPAVAKLIQALLSGKPVGMHADGFFGKVASGDFKGAASDAGKTISNAGTAIAETVKKLDPSQIKKLFDSMKRFIPSIDLKKLTSDPLGYLSSVIKDQVSNLFLNPVLGAMKGAIGMAEGGIVPGYGLGDSTSAMLTPGEFVMKRSASDSIGTSALQAMNKSGQLPQQMGEVNITMNIKTEQPIDEQFVRRIIVPTVKAEFKSASLKGEFLISDRAIRKAT